MKNTLFIFVMLLFSTQLLAQDKASFYHADYDWKTKPVLHKLTTEEKASPAVIIKDQRIFEYSLEDDGLYVLETTHKIIQVLEDQGVEAFNKVYLPVSDEDEFIQMKARSISPKGKIVNLNKDKIQQLDNVENIGNVKIFAVEGLEVNGEVEYLYTIKRPVRDPYGRETFQMVVKVKEAGIDIISPQHLAFEAKSYNGFPELKSTVDKDKEIRKLSATAKDIAPMIEENYSAYRANLMRVDYKLSYNENQFVKERLYSWDMAAESFGGLIYTYTKEEGALIQKELKKLKLKKEAPDKQAIIIEDYIKSNFSIEEGSGANYQLVDKILVNKFANELGLARLFAAFFKEAGINHQLVITSNRFNCRFDEAFESWNNFTEILFHFPDYKAYVSPISIEYRFGPAPFQTAQNHGLFIAAEKDADKKNEEVYKGTVEFIEMPKADDTMSIIEADISFDEEFTAVVDLRQAATGYRGSELRIIHKYQGEDFLKSRVKSGMEDADIDNISIENEDMINCTDNKEVIIKANMKVPSLTEKAGKSYLFNIGHIIGEQVELYQETERQADIDMHHPIYYKRVISFTIPDGYRLEGIDDIKIDKFMEVEGEKVNRFVSDYKIDGKKVTVTVDEFYHNVTLPKADYEPFREVINAAADFNKVVLVFEKE